MKYLNGVKIIDIQIINLDPSNTKILKSNGVVGYWVNYRHSLVEGCCYFIPYGGQTVELFKNYSVETDQVEVINVTHSNVLKYSMNYHAELDAYEVIGIVSIISDDGEFIIVSVYDVNFGISNEDYDVSNIKMNDWVKIEIKGLTLWDEGIF